MVNELAQDFEASLPTHAAGLMLSHNEHRSFYESVEQWIQDKPFDWVSEDERAQAVETDNVWVLHWYPATPVGFHSIAASSLAALLQAVTAW